MFSKIVSFVLMPLAKLLLGAIERGLVIVFRRFICDILFMFDMVRMLIRFSFWRAWEVSTSDRFLGEPTMLD